MATKSLRLIEKFFFILVFFLLAGPFLPLPMLVVMKPDVRHLLRMLPAGSAALIQRISRFSWELLPSVLLDVVFWGVLLALYLRRGLLIQTLKAAWKTGLALLFLLACISIIWSVSPQATLAGLYLVLKITLLGLYLSQRYSIDENLELLVGALALGSLLSLFALWQIPEQSIHLGGEWRGVFTWKNDLGRMMAFGNAVLVVYWFQNRVLWKRIITIILFVMSGLLLVFSRSATSILALVGLYSILVLYVAWLRWGMRIRPWMYWTFAAVAGVGALVAALNATKLLALLDKDASLTGRMPLWQILWGRFQERPILGFGYEAFWAQYPEGIMPPDWIDGVAHHAHNGYFDVALALGLVGLAVFLVVLALAWRRSLMLVHEKRQVVFLWPLLTLTYLTFVNLTYSVAFDLPGFYWALFVLAAASVLPVLQTKCE